MFEGEKGKHAKAIGREGLRGGWCGGSVVGRRTMCKGRWDK